MNCLFCHNPLDTNKIQGAGLDSSLFCYHDKCQGHLVKYRIIYPKNIPKLSMDQFKTIIKFILSIIG
jgi:hypothetical protein